MTAAPQNPGAHTAGDGALISPRGKPLDPSERIDRLRLCRTDGIGPRTYRRLLTAHGRAAEALKVLPELAKRGGRKRVPQPPSTAEVEAELAAAAALGTQWIEVSEPGYPQALTAIIDPPPFLSVRGDATLLGQPSIAIVGTRNASANGVRLAERLARDIGFAGFRIVSGLARGIDTAAHKAALRTGTVAVVAGGVDVIYPEENTALYNEIIGSAAEPGAVVAEMPLGVHPQARHFPRRNRLISGLCRAVIVVEAAPRSGAMITARMALEQGREVMAVPGSPLDPRARGPNDLIRQGAALVETVEDVLAALDGASTLATIRVSLPQQEIAFADNPIDEAWLRNDPDAEPPPAEVPKPAFQPTDKPATASEDELDDARATIAAALSPVPATVDELVRSCQLSPAVVTTVLLEWELAGRVERHSGNRVALVAGPPGQF